MRWLKSLKAQVRFKEPLSAHTTLGIGGPAEVWVQPQSPAELIKLICHAGKERIPYVVIGRGSNILFSDRGFNGIVISLQAASFAQLKARRTRISCGAGVPLPKLLRETQKRGLTGLEFLAGIPASVGGALVMNAGNRQKGIGNFIERATVMDGRGQIHVLNKSRLRFGYRQSNLDRYIVLEAQLKLAKGSPARIKQDIRTNLSRKKKTQVLSLRSAGCVFKNPAHRLSAGQMLEACGLKGVRRGGAEVSRKHANYIINRHHAKASDVLKLMALAKQQVRKKFGVHLEPEIKIIR